MLSADLSVVNLFFNAGFVVKCVLIFLITASIFSWAFIFQCWQTYRETEKRVNVFENYFWSGINIDQFYQQGTTQLHEYDGITRIFISGFKEYKRLLSREASDSSVLEGLQQAMRAAHNREIQRLERYLPFLASVGSISPYVGLFGTVWGIMSAFSALAQVQQATIQMVAPGISEALIATAIGLFAAIPAVIAYNRFSHRVENLLIRYESFQEEFTNKMRSELLNKTL